MHTSPSVLVVDDEPDIAAFIADALSLEGYQVRAAASGRDALALVSEAMPALILLDLRMPDMTGREFAQAYHEQFREPSIAPSVLMTASNDAPDHAAEVRAIAALSKPFELTDLIQIVERHVGGASTP